MENKINTIRENTLSQIEKTERNYKFAFLGAAIIELLFIVAFLLLADFSNRTHIILLLMTIVIYTMVGFGLIALGLHINRNTLRILQAIQLSNDDER